MFVKSGDKVPADIRIIWALGMKVFLIRKILMCLGRQFFAHRRIGTSNSL